MSDDINERERFDAEQKLKQAELALKERETALKEIESQRSSGFLGRLGPVGVGIFVAGIGLIGSLITTALHELEEEIGAIRPTLQALGSVHPYPAFSSACIHLFTATIAQIGGPQSAEGIISVETVSRARLFEMVDNGDITDASAIACILKAQLRGLI